MEESPIAILQKLRQIQIEAYPEMHGLFPSERSHPWGYFRKDYSAYFTATMLHSLMGLQSWLTSEESIVLEEIRQTACEGVSPFQNKQGLARYNFWQTNPGRHFPNGKLLGRWDHFRPPDDADDSVMIYLMQKRPLEEARWLSLHIDSYANGSRKWIQNTPQAYRKLRAYCTFFSKDMPLGFDACVIANILYFNCFYGFPETPQFQDSVRYLVQMLQREDHWKIPEKVAPYYPHTSIILFHLVRLVSRFEVSESNWMKERIKQDLARLLSGPLQAVERVMAENAWISLTGTPPTAKGENLLGRFYFFVLPLTLEYEGWLPQFLAHNRLSHIRFHCEALELSLVCQNQVLRKGLR